MDRKTILLRAVRTFRLHAMSIIVLGLSAGAALIPGTAHGQIFVTNLNGDTVGEYNLDGTMVNASLVPGLSYPWGVAVSGSELFVTNNIGPMTIGEYTLGGTPGTITSSFPSLVSGLGQPDGVAVSGSDLFVANSNGSSSQIGPIGEYTLGATPGTISSSNPSLIPGLSEPAGIAVSGTNLFVITGSNTIGEYTTSGGTVNAALVTGLNSATGIAVSGSDLFVTSYNTDTIGEYILGGTPGTITSSFPSLVTGLNSPFGIAVFGSDLFVANTNGNTVGEYTLGNTPGTITSSIPSLISGLDNPGGIFVVPEPSAWALFGIGAAALLALRPRRSQA
jgi:hypothetical protein